MMKRYSEFLVLRDRFKKTLISAAAVFFISCPAWLQACPRCVDATPYKAGLLWAVVFLLPIPFIVVGLISLWIVKNSKPDSKKA